MMATPDPPPGGWTVDTALQHVLSLLGSNDHRYEQRFIDLQKLGESQHAAHREAVGAALSSARDAVLKAEGAAEKRFDAVNEFRATLGDQQRTLMPRAEADREFSALAEKIRALEKQHDQLIAEKKGILGGTAAMVMVVGFVVTLLTLLALVIKVFSWP
jgi:small-conductance mechanosensitive channel